MDKEAIEILFQFLDELSTNDSISKEDMTKILKELFNPANLNL